MDPVLLFPNFWYVQNKFKITFTVIIKQVIDGNVNFRYF